MRPTPRPFWQTLESWLTWGLLVALLITAVSAVEAAHWIDQPMPLKEMAIGGLLLGMLLAALPVPSWAALAAAFGGGILLSLWRTAHLLPQGNLEQRFVEVALRVNAWGFAARTGGLNNDGLVFALALIALTFALGVLCTYAMFRFDSLWVAIAPPTFFLLVSLSWSPPELGRYFLVYLFLLLVVVAQVHYSRVMRDWRWRRGVAVTSTFGSFLTLSALAGLLVLSIAWVAPTGQVFDPASRLWTRVSTPWQAAKGEFNRLFASLNPGAEGTSGSFGQSLAFRSTFKLTNTAVMAVRAAEAHYWRTQVYDYYTGSGWLVSDQMTPTPALLDRWSASVPEYAARETMTQTVKVLVPQRGDLLFAAGEPRQALLPNSSRIFRVDPVEIRAYRPDSVTVRGSDFEDLAAEIRDYNREQSRTRREASIVDLQPGRIVQTDSGQLYLEDVRFSRGRITAVDAVRVPQTPPDLLTLRSEEPLARGQEYQIVSAVSTATDAQLRAAPGEIPAEIRERYLQLPPSLPQRVRDFSHLVTDSQPTAYDKVAAIEATLRQLQYQEQVPVPPPGRDGVDFFLFESQVGYCDYFASAMVVLARSSGLPARLVSGFQPGDYDAEQDAYVVRELNAHSWVEVYFPEYGWQEFEPSPSRPLRERGAAAAGDGSFNPAEENYDKLAIDDFGGFDEGDYDLSTFGQQPATALDRFNQFAGRYIVGNPAVSEALLLSAGLLTLGLLGYRLWFAGLRQLAVAPRAYEQLCRLGLLVRRPRQAHQTPLEYARVLALRLPGMAREIETIIHGYVRTTYGRDALSEGEKGRIADSWRRVRRAFLRGEWRQ